MRRFKSLDERVLQHIIKNADPSCEFISRTRARYGLLSISASEFDAVLERHGIETNYHIVTRGQQYKVIDVANAYQRLMQTLKKVEAAPLISEDGIPSTMVPDPEFKPDETV